MSMGHEWWRFHLTPRGWIAGSQRIDFSPLLQREIPSDTIITMTFHDNATVSFCEMWVEIKRVNNQFSEENLQELYEKYGRVPLGYEDYPCKLSE